MQTFLIGLGLSKEEAKASEISVPFVEVGTKDLSDKEYCFRTLRCILDAKDINPETIAKTPNATYAAYRWSYVMAKRTIHITLSTNTTISMICHLRP